MPRRRFVAPVVLIALVAAIAYLASQEARARREPPLSPYTHAPDYSWVVGALYYADIEGGFWGIRYAPEGSDAYGGRFVLGQDQRLGAFQPGDMVVLRGEIAPEQVSIWQAGTIYRIHDIRPF